MNIPINEVIAHKDIGAGKSPKVVACTTYARENKNKMIKLLSQKEKIEFNFLSFHLSSTCKTILLDKIKTAAKRYMQPMIFSLSKIIFGVLADVS